MSAPETACPASVIDVTLRPWPGLEAFTEDYKFCGRDADITELAARLKRGVGTVLYGQSGLGKTSLLQAGLMPRLEKEAYLPFIVRLIHKEDAPSPIEQLRTELRKAVMSEKARLFEPTDMEEDEDLWRYLHRRNVSWLRMDGHEVRPVIILDQFEEIFRNGQSTPRLAERSREFFEDLADLVQGRPSKPVKDELAKNPLAAEGLKQNQHDYHVLIVLREDYLPHLDTLVERFEAPDFVANRQRLLHLDGLRAIEAVEGPGAGIIDPGVAEMIVRNVAAAKQRHLGLVIAGEDSTEKAELGDLHVEPALLSLMCSRLNEARLSLPEQPGIPQKISEALLKGVAGKQVLPNFYQDSIGALLPSSLRKPMKEFIEEKLISEKDNYRQQMVFDSAVAHLVRRGVAEAPALAAIEDLIHKQRLLRVEDRGDTRRIELIHDVLCSVVAQFRDDRRKDAKRWKRFWKALGAVAVIGLACLGTAWYQVSEREDARDRADREKEMAAEIARTNGIAEAVTKEQKKAKANLSKWYEQRVAETSLSGQVASASLILAKGIEETDMPATPALQMMTPEPRLQRVGSLNIGHGEGIAKLSWTKHSREILAMTTANHLVMASATGNRVLWFSRNELGLHWRKAAPTLGDAKLENLVEICCAIPWIDETGTEGILVSIKGGGVCFILPREDEKADTRFSEPVGDVTALFQSPDGESTWAGLANGLLFKLTKDARSEVEDSVVRFPSLPRTSFDQSSPMLSPRGKWLYVPVEESRPSYLRSRQGKTAHWHLIAANQLRKGSGFFNDILPGFDATEAGYSFLDGRLYRGDESYPTTPLNDKDAGLPLMLLFSPDDSLCVVASDSLAKKVQWKRAYKPVKKAPSPGNGAVVIPDKTRASQSSEKLTFEATNGPELNRDSLSNPLVLLDNGCLISGSRLDLKAHNVKKGSSATAAELTLKPKGTAGGELKIRALLPMIAREGSMNQLLVVLADKDKRFTELHVVGVKGEKENAALSVIGAVAIKPITELPELSPDGSAVLWQELDEGNRVHFHKIDLLQVAKGIQDSEVPWRELASKWPQNRIGGLATDVQGGLLCVSAEKGTMLVDVRNGRPVKEDGPFPWANASPEKLNAHVTKNGFSVSAGNGGVWSVDIPPYLTGEDPAPVSYVENGTLTLNGILNGVSFPGNLPLSQAEHPAGKYQVTCKKDGTLSLRADDLTEEWLMGPKPCTEMAFSGDGRLLAAGNAQGWLILWRLNLEEERRLEVHTAIGGLQIEPALVPRENGEFILADATGLHRWDPQPGNLVQLPLPDHVKVLLGAGGGSSPGQAAYGIASTTDGRLLLFNAESRAELASVPWSQGSLFSEDPSLEMMRYTPLRAQVSPDGQVLAVFGMEGRVELWRRDGSHLIRIRLPETLCATEVAFGDAQQLILIYRPAGWEWKPKTEGEKPMSHLVAWETDPLSPNVVPLLPCIQAAAYEPGLGKFLVSCETEGLRLMDKEGGLTDEEKALPGKVPTRILTAPGADFALLVPGSLDDAAELFDPKSFRILGGLPAAYSQAFSAGGCILPGQSGTTASTPCVAAVSEWEVRLWSGHRPWSSAEAMQLTGLSIDEWLVTSPCSDRQAAALPFRAAPPPAPSLEQGFAWQNRALLDLAAGPGHPFPALPATLRSGFSDLKSSAKFEVQDLTAAAATPLTTRSAAMIMNCLESGSEVEELPACEMKDAPRAFAADFARMSALAGWNHAMKMEGTAKLEQKGNDFSPAIKEVEARCLVILEKAEKDGGRRSPNAPVIALGYKEMLKAREPGQPEFRPVKELKRRVEIARNLTLVDPTSAVNRLILADMLAALEEAAGEADAVEPSLQEIERIRCLRDSVWAGRTFNETGYESLAMESWSAGLYEAYLMHPGNSSKATWHREALALAWKAVEAAEGKSSSAWTNLAEISTRDEERLDAVEQALQIAMDQSASDLAGVRQAAARVYRQLECVEAVELLDDQLASSLEDRQIIPALISMGELLRRCGAPGESLPWFEKARKMEEDHLADLKSGVAAATKAAVPDKIAEAQEQYDMAARHRRFAGRMWHGRALQQLGENEKAAALYQEACGGMLFLSDLDELPLRIAFLAVDRGDTAKCLETIRKLESKNQWEKLARIARHWNGRSPGDEQAKALALRILAAVPAIPAATPNPDPENLRARALALALTGSDAEALATMDQATAASEEQDACFGKATHLTYAGICCRPDPQQALVHLAKAAGSGWQDRMDLMEDPELMSALADKPEFQDLLAALELPYDSSARYLAIARFIKRVVDPDPPDPEQQKLLCELLVWPLAQAVRLGALDPGGNVGPGGELSEVSLSSAWPEKLKQARNKAKKLVERERAALSLAYQGVPENLRRPGKSQKELLKQALKNLTGNTRLARVEGTDIFGNSFEIDPRTGEAKTSAETTRILEEFNDVGINN